MANNILDYSIEQAQNGAIQNAASSYADITAKMAIFTATEVGARATKEGLVSIEYEILKNPPISLEEDVVVINRFNDFLLYPLIIDPITYRKGEALIETDEFGFIVAEINIEKKKRVIVNELNFSDESIKEITGASDYNIDISGLLISDSFYEKPLDQINKFIELMKANITLPVTSTLLNNIGIRYIAIKNFKFNSNWKSKNTLPFTFTAVSDNPEAKIII